MSKKLFFATFVFLAIFSFIPRVSQAATNAGFIPAPIWFSLDTLSAGTTTKVSTLVYNSSSDAISMTVTFYDGDVVLGSKAAIVSAQSSKEFTIDWKVTVGDHAIRAHIGNPRKGTAQGAAVTIANTDTDAYRFSVLADLGIHPFTTGTTPSSTTTTAGTTTTTTPPAKNTPNSPQKAIIAGTQDTFNKFDGFRSGTAVELAKNVTVAEQVLKDAQAGTPKADGSKPSTPFAYVKLFFLRIFSFIFGNTAMFYGLIVLIIILFVRYLIRAPR